MEPTKTLKPRDVLSYLGRDYVVEGVLTYRLGGKVHPVARAVDGEVVLWVEPPVEDLDDRVLLFTAGRDPEIVTPPPQSISYRKSAFLPKWSGRAAVEVTGSVPGRHAGEWD